MSNNQFSLDLEEDGLNINNSIVSEQTETKIQPLETTNTMIPFRTSTGNYQTKSIIDITPEEFMSWVNQVFPYPNEVIEQTIKSKPIAATVKQRQVIFDVIVTAWNNKWLFVGKPPKASKLWN